METAPLSMMRLEFAKRAEAKRDDERRNLATQKKKDEDRADERREKQDSHDAAMAMATEIEIAEFEVTLDRYDTATVEALLENEEQMAVVREQLSDLLAKAYTLPDGRKVFESEDGVRVFDQNGVEVRDVDPNDIEDWRPKWEVFHAEQEDLSGLQLERTELIKFQTELDDARNRVDEGGLTEKELKDLEDQLKRDAPQSVRESRPR